MDLARGQRQKLSELTSEDRLKVSVAISDGDVVVALFLDEKGVSVTPSVVVSDDHPVSPCGSVMVRPGSKTRAFEVNLRKVPATTASILWAVAVDPHRSSGTLSGGEWSVAAESQTVARFGYGKNDVGVDGAFTLGELYRKNGEWRLRAVGEGFTGGLSTMLSRFNVRGAAPATGGRAAIMGDAPAGVWLPAGWPGNRTPSVPKDLARAVGIVVTQDAEGKTYSGTAFAISPGGYLVTCWHVVHDAVDIAVAFGGSSTLRKLEVVALDEASDLALCWLSDRNGVTDWLMPAAADTEPGLGDELGLLGYPLGVSLGAHVTYTQGVVSSLRQRRGSPVLQLDAGSTTGSSGGPVFHRSTGVVVGVLASGLSMDGLSMNINFASDIRVLWKLGWVERL